MFGKKRAIAVGATVATIGAVVLMAAGVTFGFFSDNYSNNSATFSAGTVLLDHTYQTSCTTGNNLAAGDSYTCNFPLNYIGGLAAHIGVNLTASGNLWTDNSGATVSISSNLNGGSGTPLTSTAANSGNVYLGDVGPDAGAFTLHVTFSLPVSATDQGQSAVVAVTVLAVQAAHNPDTFAGGCPVVGGGDCGISWS